MQMCPGKEIRSSNYCAPGILEGLKKNQDRARKQKNKNYQRNVIKI